MWRGTVSDQPTPDPLEANAYAITFRLLGDRPAASAASRISAERVRARRVATDPRLLADLAAEAVRNSVGVIAEGRRAQPATSGSLADVAPGSDDEALRAALRRRLASSPDPQRSAAALHHLAGYPIEQVAGFLGVGVEEAARDAAVLAPPPGVSYRTLGDPLVRGTGAATTPRVRHRRRRLVRWTTVVPAVVVVALVVAAGRSVGERPTLGPAQPGRASVQVGPDVAATASAGCSAGASDDGTGVVGGSVLSRGTARPYRLAVPEPTTGHGPGEPHGLVVALTGYGQTAEEFQAQTDLEARALEAGYLVATIEPAEPELELNVAQDSRRPDDTLFTLAVVDDVVARRCVDLNRVHAVGFGPGGQMAGALACIRPQVFASASSVSGAFLPEPCTLDPPVSLLVVWNADDDVLPVTGGYGPGLAGLTDPAAAVSRPPAPAAADVLTRWGDLIDAGPASEQTDPSGTVTTERLGGTGGTGAELVVSTTGGHGWGPTTADTVMTFVREHARST